MPTPTPGGGDHTEELDQLFLDQYKDARQSPAGPTPLATPEQMMVATALIVTTIVQAELPELAADVRALMTGQLTPGVREMILAAIQLLTDHPDIAAEAGFGPEVFDHIARSDVELQNLGGIFNDLVVSLGQAEGQQRAALLAFNGQVLLTVHHMLDEMNEPAQRALHDVLQGKFRAAFSVQDELSAQRSQQNAAKDTSAQPSQKVLKEQLAQVTRDAGVRRAVTTIQAVARTLDKTGATPLLSTSAGPAQPGQTHGHDTTGSPAGNPGGKGQGQ